jgi:hypothetical protein
MTQSYFLILLIISYILLSVYITVPVLLDKIVLVLVTLYASLLNIKYGIAAVLFSILYLHIRNQLLKEGFKVKKAGG